MGKIDVQEIMEGIRKEIADRGYTKEEISYAQALANMDAASLDKCYNPRALRMKYEYLQGHYNNPIYFKLKGNPVKALFQKVIRRFFLFVIYPAFHYQNVYNEAVADCIRQVKNYIEENEPVKHMPAKVAALEKQVREQQEQINALQKEISRLVSGSKTDDIGRGGECEA